MLLQQYRLLQEQANFSTGWPQQVLKFDRGNLVLCLMGGQNEYAENIVCVNWKQTKAFALFSSLLEWHQNDRNNEIKLFYLLLFIYLLTLTYYYYYFFRFGRLNEHMDCTGQQFFHGWIIARNARILQPVFLITKPEQKKMNLGGVPAEVAATATATARLGQPVSAEAQRSASERWASICQRDKGLVFSPRSQSHGEERERPPGK